MRRITFAAVAVLVLLALPMVVAGPFTDKGSQPGLTFDPYPPSACDGCHSGLDNGENVRPYPRWSGSMMANAARDPIFWAALDVANNDIADVGDLCLRCHTPVEWLAGLSEPPVGSTDGCSLQGDIDQNNTDFEGVQCTLCHRMMVNPTPPAGEDSVYFENAQFWIDDETCDNGFEPCRRGPYPYNNGNSEAPHPWVYSEYHVNGDLCGNCHNVTHPAANLLDDTGADTGVAMPVERTFKEWQQSDFSQPGESFRSCQNCHMPDATHDPASPCIFQSNNRTGDLPIHHFAGGNSWIPTVLGREYPNLGRQGAFASSAAEAIALLESSASLDLSAPAATVTDADLDLAVTVTNLTGHKLPTGYPEGRRMWLWLEVRDGNDAVLWESGAYDTATGDLTIDAQAKVYQTKPGIWNFNGTNQCDTTDGDGSPLFHFVLNNCITLDNRIPPLGFTGRDDLETRSVGYTYPETTPGSGVSVNYDVTDYVVQIPAATAGPLTVTSTLYYQTISKEYVEFLRDQAVDNNFPDDCITRSDSGAPTMSRGEILYSMWTRYGRAAPVAMVSQSTTVDIMLFADGFESGDLQAWSGGG